MDDLTVLADRFRELGEFVTAECDETGTWGAYCHNRAPNRKAHDERTVRVLCRHAGGLLDCPGDPVQAWMEHVYGRGEYVSPPDRPLRMINLLAYASAEALDDLAFADSDQAGRANYSKIFPKGEYGDRDFVEFLYHLDSHRDGKRKDTEIAREYTGESVKDDPRAKRLLARYRKARSANKIGI